MENHFMRVEEVAKELDASKSYACKLIQTLNNELKEKATLLSQVELVKSFSWKECIMTMNKIKEGNSKWQYTKKIMGNGGFYTATQIGKEKESKVANVVSKQKEKS